jgi:hypothetical protein
MRELAAEKMSISAIAEQIEKEYGGKCRYQQVYNVLRYSIGLRNDVEAEKAKGARIEHRAPKHQTDTIQEFQEGELEEDEDEL